MNIHLRTVFILLALFVLNSCKKGTNNPANNEEYIQHFNAVIAGKSVRIENSISKDRFRFHGSWTGVDEFEMYNVNIVLDKELLKSTSESKLMFQIFDIKKKEYEIKIDDPFEKDLASHIYLQKNSGKENEILYTTSSVKKPFKIEIIKYELPKKNLPPIVGGKLNGVLYNTKDLRDSIVIQNGNFEVRF